MDNPDPQATLGTRHRTKTNNTKNITQKAQLTNRLEKRTPPTTAGKGKQLLFLIRHSKRVIRSRKSKKDKHYNGQQKKYKKQTMIYSTLHRTRTPLNTGVEDSCPGRITSPCSTSDIAAQGGLPVPAPLVTLLSREDNQSLLHQ